MSAYLVFICSFKRCYMLFSLL